MRRSEAEKLLAALIFGDLDESSRADLTAYLEGDDELRERLADMRMAMKVASDTLGHGPDPVLSEGRMKRLEKLSRRRENRRVVFTVRRMAVAAGILVAVWLPAYVILNKVNKLKPGLDISGGGILIQTSVQAPIGSYLLINLQIESFDGPVYVFGQVRWSGISDTGRGLFQCGIMFITTEEQPTHFSPAAMNAIPAIMRQFNRNTRYELEACLIGASGGSNKRRE